MIIRFVSFLVFALALPSSPPALAQAEGTTSAEIKSTIKDRREVSVSPGIGYTEQAGWLYGVSGSAAFPMSLRSQIELGGILYRHADRTGDEEATGVFVGPLYNFGSDFKRNVFAGVGVGYSHIYPFQSANNSDERLLFGYGQIGKRFALNESGTLSFKPRVMYYTRGADESAFQIDVINFSYLY